MTGPQPTGEKILAGESRIAVPPAGPVTLPPSRNFGIEAGAGIAFGYARVSTEDQRLDLQIDALTRHGIPEDRIFREKVSSARAQRPEWALCRRILRAGDTLVVWRLDRLFRSTIELAGIAREFEAERIELVSLSENIDTATAGGRLVFHVFAAVAQFERDIISERTRAGLAAARRAGKKIGGRKPVVSAAKLRMAETMRREAPDRPMGDIAQALGVGRSSLYRAFKRKADAAAGRLHDDLVRTGRLPGGE